MLTKRAMLAISRAIEDECCAQAERPVLIGAFQEQRFFHHSEPRWRELARTAELAIAFADFPHDRLDHLGLLELTLADDAPLRREWAVVCDAPNAAACLAGVERPGQRAAGCGAALRGGLERRAWRRPRRHRDRPRGRRTRRA